MNNSGPSFQRNGNANRFSSYSRPSNRPSNGEGSPSQGPRYDNPNRQREWRDNGPRNNNYQGRPSGPSIGNVNNAATPKTSFSATSNRGNMQAPPPLTAGKLRCIPISGQCELGRSAWSFEQEDEIVLIDAGIGFVPHGFKGGVDALLPNLQYLLENKSKIKALFISNPHEEFAGDLLNFIEQLELKELYLPKILIELHKGKIPADVKVTSLEGNAKYKIGQQFSITSFDVTFSTIDSFAFLIETSGSRVFYTGAFKIDHAPPIRAGQTQIHQLSGHLTEKGVDLLISSSTNIESSGYTASESSVAKKFTDIMQQANSRVITIISASSVHRLHLLLQVAQKTKRKVCLLGEETLKWYEAAKAVGYLNFPSDLFITKQQLTDGSVKPDQILIIIGALEGDVLEPFTELAYKTFPDTSLQEKDTLVVSANPPLGTSRLLANAVDQLFLLGVNVIGGRDAGVYVSGYASQEELKFMYNLTRPRYFLPSHGESRQLVLHAELLGRCGVDPKNVVIVDNGAVVDFEGNNDKVEIVGRIPAQPVMFSKALDGSMNNQSLEERRSLSEDGTITVVLALNFKEAKLVGGPYLKIFGSSFDKYKDWADIQNTITQDISFVVNRALKQGQKESGIIRHLTHDVVSKKVRERYGMSKPVLSIVVQEVG